MEAKTPWTKASIQLLLETNNRAVERALVVLFDRQTQDEKGSSTTRYTNHRGFTQADAGIMSSMARWVLKGRSLTDKQLAFLRGGRSARYHSRIGKYARQLLEEITTKQAKAA